MKKRVNALLEGAGLAAVAVGAGLYSVPAGFIVGGLLAVGYSVFDALAGKP